MCSRAEVAVAVQLHSATPHRPHRLVPSPLLSVSLMIPPPPPLPPALAVSVHLQDSVRRPNTTIAGTITIHIPTHTTIQQISGGEINTHGTSSSVTPSNSTPNTPASAATSRTIQHQTQTPITDNNNDNQSDPASSSPPHLPVPAVRPSSPPLSRPFPFLLKVQLVGKILFDKTKVSIEPIIMKRFRPPNEVGTIGTIIGVGGTQRDNTSGGIYSGKIWSTRILPIPVPETATFPYTIEFRARLPDSLPPTWRGSAITCMYYVHAIAITSSPLSSPSSAIVPSSSSSSSSSSLPTSQKKILDLKVPFRVRVGSCVNRVIDVPANMMTNIQHCIVASTTTTETTTNASSQTVTLSSINGDATNPHDQPQLTHPSSSSSDPPTADPLSDADSYPSDSSSLPSSFLSDPPAPVTFNISKSLLSPSTGIEFESHVVRLTLDQRFLRPGDTIRGHLDFSRARLRCYRVAIALQQQETIDSEFMPRHSKQPFTNARTFASFHTYTLHTLSTNFLFSLPLDVVANFQTEFSSVRWNLVFKFITDIEPNQDPTIQQGGTSTPASSSSSASPSPSPSPSSFSFLPSPSTTHAESLVWTLPLQVLPHDDTEVVKQRTIKTVLFAPNVTV